MTEEEKLKAEIKAEMEVAGKNRAMDQAIRAGVYGRRSVKDWADLHEEARIAALAQSINHGAAMADVSSEVEWRQSRRQAVTYFVGQMLAGGKAGTIHALLTDADEFAERIHALPEWDDD